MLFVTKKIRESRKHYHSLIKVAWSKQHKTWYLYTISIFVCIYFLTVCFISNLKKKCDVLTRGNFHTFKWPPWKVYKNGLVPFLARAKDVYCLIFVNTIILLTLRKIVLKQNTATRITNTTQYLLIK